MTTKPLIDDMNHFFAQQWQQLADEIERESPQLEAERIAALAKARIYQDRIISGVGF